MPELFNRIGQPRWMEAIRRLLALEGAQGITTVMPELVPVHIAVPDGPEVAALRQDRLCIGGNLIAAGGAGTFGKVQLHNPASSGILIIVEWWTAIAGATTGLDVRIGTGAIAAAGGVTGFRDGRWGLAAARVPVGQIEVLADATTTGVVVANGVGIANEEWPRAGGPPFVLQPDDKLQVMAQSENTALRVNFAWRERIVLPGELVV